MIGPFINHSGGPSWIALEWWERFCCGVEHIVRRKSPVDFSIWITYNKTRKNRNERCFISVLVSLSALWRDRDVICRISGMHYLSKDS